MAAQKKTAKKKRTTQKKRPEHRDVSLGTKVPAEVARKARAKAKKEKRSLAAIIRSFLMGWADDEYETPAVRPGENTRAKRRTKKKDDSE